MHKIKFGTDGWRGIISDDFTFENVRRVGIAIADYFNNQKKILAGKKPAIVVGYDTRFLSDIYAHIIAEVMSSRNIKVVLSDRAIPTPALSFNVRFNNMTAGVMITASHNPAIYNGIKIKTSSGGAAGIEVTKEIEKRIPPVGYNLTTVAPVKIKKADLVKDYINFLRSYVDLKRLKKTKFKVLIDAMHGSGDKLIARILKDTRISLDFVRDSINPSFGGLRPEPILENLSPTINRLREKRYDLGLVLDGDADRIAGFAGSGEFIHPQKILGLLILHLVRNRGMSGGVIKTIAGTTLIDRITSSLGLRLYETPVGFKYISELMQKTDILIGGEEAGGIGFKGYVPERDGSLAGLLLLELMSYKNKPILKILNEMEREFGRYYYLREDIRVHKMRSKGAGNLSEIVNRFKSKKTIVGRRVIQCKDFDGVKLICEDDSWLMLRASGTEPLMRVYAEAKSLARAKQLIDFGRGWVLR